MDKPFDCVVVGAGPAGLTAALYLARYRRSVFVVHDGRSRALRIPLTHNAPACPGGVKGSVIVSRMSRQARAYGATITKGRVTSVTRLDDGFRVRTGRSAVHGRSVILATGVCLNEIDLDRGQHEAAIEAGCLRYCPVCDGFEATGRRVGVVGSDTHGAAEALFLRRYSDQVTLFPRKSADLSAAERALVVHAGIDIIDAPVDHFEPHGKTMGVRLVTGERLVFDVLYPALGCTPRSELAQGLEIDLTKQGCIATDQRQATGVPGVYAAGDIVDGLDQISVAIGQGAVAATHAHNDLRARDQEALP